MPGANCVFPKCVVARHHTGVGILKLQARTKYSRTTMGTMRNSSTMGRYGNSSISIFKESFASIDKIFFLGRRLDTRL